MEKLRQILKSVEAKRSSKNYFWKTLVLGKDLIWKTKQLFFVLKKYDINIDKKVEYCLISFPKCGRTWLRVMIKKAVQLHFGLNSRDIFDLMFEDITEEDLNQADICLPRIFVSHDDDPHWKKSWELVRSKRKYANKKVIFLVRDPRDTIVSVFFQQSRRVTSEDVKWDSPRRLKPYKGTLHQYLHEKIGGFETLLKFYNIWDRNKHVPKGFLLIRYEDIYEDPPKELRKVLDFLGLKSVSDEVIDKAVKFASFENMRRMEDGGEYSHLGVCLKPADRNDGESYKTRRGKVGGYADYLNREDIEYLNRRIKDSFPKFYGYEIYPKDHG